MTRQKQYKAIITDESYMEDLIWMSYRYCIGRHTIASHSHAEDIAKYSFDHISENKKSFMAHDIRQEINDTLRWKNNIECRDYRDRLDKDALEFFNLLSLGLKSNASIYNVFLKFLPYI